MLAHLIGADERRIAEDGVVAGTILESFVAMELLRQTDWADRPAQLFHYRDKEHREVDVVIERHDGDIVGIEVKASATPSAEDFAGLRYLRDKLGQTLQVRRRPVHRRRHPAVRRSPGGCPGLGTVGRIGASHKRRKSEYRTGRFLAGRTPVQAGRDHGA